MRIYVAGAAGVIGRYLIPALIADGHQVTGSTRSAGNAEKIAGLGATPVIVDGLDRQGVIDAVKAATPEVVIHEMTALASLKDFRHFDKEFAVTNELRTRGTDYLLEAAQQAGATRFIAQSYTNWPNERTGGPVKTEDDPLDPNPPANARESMAAIEHVERVVKDNGGIALRYGGLYGHGASEDMLDPVARRRFPIVGGGTGLWSFCEVTDAAAATAAAVSRGEPGIYNIVDDDPAPVSEWLPYLARLLGAKPPRRLPAWLARPLAGEFAVATMTEIRGSSNAKAKRELGWAPRYASWREGFPAWVKSISTAG
jgi:nucleoside-diphosphate-sugar epimerase